MIEENAKDFSNEEETNNDETGQTEEETKEETEGEEGAGETGEDEGKEEEGEQPELDLSKIEPEVDDEFTKTEERGEDEDEDEFDDKQRLREVINKELTPIKIKLQISEFVQKNPEYAKYKGVMFKYKSHPSYKGIPVSNIAAIVAAKDLQKLGAEKEREAQERASKAKNVGSTVRKPDGGKVDWLTASKEDFQAMKTKILNQRRD